MINFIQPRMHQLERSMNEREDTIKVLKDRMNRVEDELFESFCAQIGVENIRLVKLIIILFCYVLFLVISLIVKDVVSVFMSFPCIDTFLGNTSSELVKCRKKLGIL